jgi:hypothetical protein
VIYEPPHVAPLPRHQYYRRLLGHGLVALGIIGLSLVVGMAGYEHFEQLQWRDAFMEAAMLLGGMGPVHAPVTPDGKVFAGLYALYAGLIFLAVTGIVFAPVVHRLLHVFHWEQQKR